jgi:hypothetical protein
MSQKVQTVAPAPVLFTCFGNRRMVENGSFLATNYLFCWSGREDSNLRPLPPERVSPSGTGVGFGALPSERNSTGWRTLWHDFNMNLVLSLRPLSMRRLCGAA